MPAAILAARTAANDSLSVLRQFFEALDCAFEMKRAFDSASYTATSTGSIERLRRAAARG